MVVAFRHLLHDNTWLDTIDCLATGSNIAHVQIVFRNGAVGGAWTKTGGVGLRSIKDTIIYPFLYDFIKVDDLNEHTIYKFINQRQGQPFSILGSWVTAGMDDKKVWHCSDIIYSALKEGGLRTRNKVPAPFTSPQRIYDILLTENNYKRIGNGCSF